MVEVPNNFLCDDVDKDEHCAQCRATETNKVSCTAKFSKIRASTSEAKGRDFASEGIISKAFT